MNQKQKNNRHRRIILTSLLIYLFSCFSGTASAQASGIKYLRFTRHNFLATNQVNYIIQDRKRFMWFATSNGIQRFDGNRWLWISQRKNSPKSLPDNDVSLLLEDAMDRFWVMTASSISLLNRNNLEFSQIKINWRKEDKDPTFQSLVELQDGHIWLTLADGGLYFYDDAGKQFIPADALIPASTWTIYQIAYDGAKRQYYLGTNAGLVIYNSVKRQFYHSGFNPDGIPLLKYAAAQKSNVTLYLNSKSELWFSSFAIHSCYNLSTDSLIFCDSISRIWGVLGYTTDKSGTTWSYGANIAKMNLQTGRMELISQTPDELYGINFQYGVFFMEDSESTYWIATNNGVFIYNRFQQQFFQHRINSYATGQPLDHINTWGFIELADSSVVALTSRGDGLYFFNKQLQQQPSKFNLSAYANAKSWVNIRCGFKDRDEHLWVATEKGDLLKLYPENGRVERIDDTSLAKPGVYSMTEDKEGNIWFGSFHRTILRRDAVSGKFTTILSKLGDEKSLDNIYCLFYDGSKYIWAGSSKAGLIKVNTQTNTIEKIYANEAGNNKSIPSSRIFSITESSAGELMMSTPIGIVVMDIAKETFRLLNTANGLPDNNTDVMLKGQRRNMWFASDNGISKLRLDGLRITSYGILEGLSNEAFNINAGLRMSDGRMLFGNSEGFTSFDPSAFTKEPVPDDARITGVRLFDKYLNIDSILSDPKGLVLNYSQNFLTIEFSNMSFLHRYHTIYYYQLKGVDKEWIAASAQPQATYTYLPGGEYIFKVRTVTRNGTNSAGITSFRIKIIPPIWRQWWFYVIAVLGISGLVYIFLRSSYQQEMEAEKGRSRIAKDLHDDMGSTLSTINILSEMAKTKIDTDIPTTKKFIHQISDNSNRIMESLDDIVWNIDTANDTMENTLSRMREFAGNLLEARGISYTFKEDERIKNVNLELGRRHDFFMIFKEAINNLAKYSDCGTVNIEISIKKNMLHLLIADDGKGFEHSSQFEGNGLQNMQQRAAALNGTLSIKSELTKGTTVDLKMPI